MEEKRGKLKVISGRTITQVMQEANSIGLHKEDIVSILYNNQYLVVYEERS